MAGFGGLNPEPWHNVSLTRIACLVLLVALAACDRLPESYPPPEQRPAIQESELGPESMLVAMDSPDADRLIVKDIYPGTGISWRWTKKDPTVRVPVLPIEGLKFTTDFAIWNDGFKVTGPLEVSFLVNGKLLDKIRYASSGDKHFEKPVPRAWLEGRADATISLSVNKLYTAPGDGAKFGVILTRLGLKP